MKIEIGKIYGVKIMADLDFPVGEWNPENENFRKLSKLVLDLDRFLRCGLMRLESIEITSPIYVLDKKK